MRVFCIDDSGQNNQRNKVKFGKSYTVISELRSPCCNLELVRISELNPTGAAQFICSCGASIGKLLSDHYNIKRKSRFIEIEKSITEQRRNKIIKEPQKTPKFSLTL
ncbi:hypothetical protein LPTSP1_36700 [Leptospira johnsonii]|uniref:Uncharacterized protein n=1 Tax=Leptospira johnsonii TaxID=1917820 RepID=A0A2P2D7P5_9LEPT|nr:hypothetical protein LPTSP1_36700 [Leptospira johnsonii]